ncbi:MAG: class I SAM-dependent methyltransferase [Dehalococcoidia bacterium]
MSSDVTSDPWSVVAPLYDLDFEEFDDDVTMYRELASRQRGAVLELACGTGRVAAELARAGLGVVGVDFSAGMLAVARERCRGLAVEFVEGDIRDVRLGRRFGCVLIPLGSLQHLEAVDDVIAALTTVAAHLADDGVAVIDVEAPQPEDFTSGPRPLVAHWTRAWRDGLVTKLVAVDGIPSECRRQVTFHYDIQPREGALRRVSHGFNLRTITSGELELAGRLAGLEMTALYGDYELTPLGDGDLRQVAVFELAR